MRSGLLTRLSEFACRTQSTNWILAAAISGTTLAPVGAQEIQPAGTPEKFESEDQRFLAIERYQRTSQPAPIKNYYQELFGNQTEASAATAPNKLQSAALLRPIETEPVEPTEPKNPVVLTAQYEYAPTSGQVFTVTPVSATQEADSYDDLPAWAKTAKASLKPQEKSTSPAVTPVKAMNVSMPTATLKIETPVRIDTPVVTPGANSTAPEVAGKSAIEIAAGPQNPNVKVEWTSKEGINVGQESSCELIVSNSGSSTAYNVEVDARFPADVQLISTNPAQEELVPDLTWSLGNIPAGETRSIQVVLVPTHRGALNATAEVHFTAAAQSGFVVREPLLGLSNTGPEQVIVGDPASQSVTITNPGNGIAKNVRLDALIPEGLEHTRGERLIMDVGSLNPGESRTIRLALSAMTGGDKVIQVSASAEGGLLETSSSTMKVIAPSLTAAIDGPGLRYKGRTATYKLKVVNDGTIGTSNVRMMHKIPEGFEYIGSSRGATYDAPTRILSWFVGKLEAGKAAEMEVELNASQIGEFTHYVRATSEHGSTTDTQVVTRVEGASALVMDIVDLDDPVEVGNETAYEIKVRNEGSAAAEDIGISCELPEGVQLVKASGPAEFVTEGNLILFKPLPTIAAGESATYRVFVVGHVDGNLVFRARVTSAASPEALTFEELTRFYGDVR